MIFSNYKEFIDKVYKKLEELNVDINNLKIDHLGYQANSAEDYSNKISELKDITTKLSENIVGGRRVGIFRLHEPIDYKNYKISIIEIFEPRAGQNVESNWEHIEFLVSTSLEDFMGKYSTIDWDTTALNRDEFPMLILSLGDGIRAKFPRLGVEQEIKRIDSIN